MGVSRICPSWADVGPSSLNHGTEIRISHTATASAAAPISCRIRFAACAGCGFPVIGLPTTMWLAPARIASAGVTTRTWSPISAPAGRTPGVTMANPVPRSRRRAYASCAEATIPPIPALRAIPANRRTWSATPTGSPNSWRSSSDREVRTVTARIKGLLELWAAASAAARSIFDPPEAWTVNIETFSAAADLTASATVFGMSWNLRSKKTLRPEATKSRTT